MISKSGPCRVIAPTLVNESKEKNVKLVSVHIDENPNTAQKLGASVIPLLVAFQGGRSGGSVKGTLSKEQLAKFFDTFAPAH